MDSSRRSLGARFKVGLRTGLGLSTQNAAPAPAVAVATTITAGVHFAVEKLGEIDYEILVLARSKREVENALDVDWFCEHLHEFTTRCRYAISCACARKGLR